MFQVVLWAHVHPAEAFPRALHPRDLSPEVLFHDGDFVVRGCGDARAVLMSQQALKNAFSHTAWCEYVDFLASLLADSRSLHRIRSWVLSWKTADPWAAPSTMDDLFGGPGRVRLR